MRKGVIDHKCELENKRGGNVKKKFSFIFICLISWSFALGDVYIKIKTHHDSYYDMGRITPEADSIEEQWIVDKKMAFITENLTTIYDLEKNQMNVINRNKKIYAQTPLPLDISKLVTEQFYSELQTYKIKGTIKETGETKEIGEWNCKKYAIETWIASKSGNRFNQRDFTIWMTNDVPFDLGMVGEIISYGRKLEYYGDDFISELKKIKGYQIALEMTRYSRGQERKYSEEVVEISQKKPLEDIYSVPAGFTKKEKLSEQDFE